MRRQNDRSEGAAWDTVGDSDPESISMLIVPPKFSLAPSAGINASGAHDGFPGLRAREQGIRGSCTTSFPSALRPVTAPYILTRFEKSSQRTNPSHPDLSCHASTS